jgi:dUTP pyrophosphatase
MLLDFYKKHPAAAEPSRSYENAAGYDLHALLLTESGHPSISYIHPQQTKAIPTGLVLIPPKGTRLTICSRSGLALHDPPIFVANAPAVIDPDYTGELKVVLYNGGYNMYAVRHGERIAQLIVNPLLTPELHEVFTPPEETERGEKGFGSTGL